mmetsp:Transcript_5633/g.16763  ORF Transcript_5633/g.16763 Transcript_5633/m.16763 type:complete len:111 (+) Transcript_5633:1051-1383(+)
MTRTRRAKRAGREFLRSTFYPWGISHDDRSLPMFNSVKAVELQLYQVLTAAAAQASVSCIILRRQDERSMPCAAACLEDLKSCSNNLRRGSVQQVGGGVRRRDKPYNTHF